MFMPSKELDRQGLLQGETETHKLGNEGLDQDRVLVDITNQSESAASLSVRGRQTRRTKKTISKKELEEILESPDVNGVKSREGLGGGFGRFEGSKKRKYSVEGQLSPRSKSKLDETLKDKENYVPNCIPGSPDQNGKITYVSTPHGKTKLSRHTSMTIDGKNVGIFCSAQTPKRMTGMVSHKSLLELLTADVGDNKFIEEYNEKVRSNIFSGELKKIQESIVDKLDDVPTPPVENVKRAKRVKIDKSRLDKWTVKAKKSHREQKSILKMSAGEYLDALGFQNFKNHERCAVELTHGMAFSFGGIDGKDPQVIDNIFVATAGCNTHMMITEQLVRYLVKNHGEVYVSFEAQLIEGTHIAHTVYYEIECKGRLIEFRFDGLRYDAPAIGDYDYLVPIVESLLPPKEIKARKALFRDKENNNTNNNNTAETSTAQNNAQTMPATKTTASANPVRYTEVRTLFAGQAQVQAQMPSTLITQESSVVNLVCSN